MSFSRGDIVWLRVDKLEGLGRRHPAVVVSHDEFNDSHKFGYVIRGSHSIPRVPRPEEFVIRRDPENKLDQDTVFGSIIQTANWSRMQTYGGKIRPNQVADLARRVARILSA